MLFRSGTDGTVARFEILGDPAHKRASPLLYQRDEVLECWKLITARVLWVEGDQTDTARWWGTRYSKAEFHQRLNVVRNVERHQLSPAGHMLHHDSPRRWRSGSRRSWRSNFGAGSAT